MDLNDVRSVLTLILMITFVLIVFWAWSHKRKDEFRDAANMPLNEPETPRSTPETRGGTQ